MHARHRQGTSQSLSATVEETNVQASAVAAAAEQASTNVQTVSAAAEQLSSSITEIARQIAGSAKIAKVTVNPAGKTNTTIQELAQEAVGAIGVAARVDPRGAGRSWRPRSFGTRRRYRDARARNSCGSRR